MVDYLNFTAGLTSGVVSTVALFPLDLIKTQLQVQNIKDIHSHKNSFSAVSTILKESGVKGFYSGAFSGAVGSGLSWGSYFYFYEKMKLNFSQKNGNQNLSAFQFSICAVVASAATTLLCNPIFVVKTRMQLQRDLKSPTNYTGLLDGFKKMSTEEGIRGFYKGLGPALILNSLHGGLQFASLEKLKIYDKEHGILPNEWYSSFIIGSISKVVSTVGTYPISVIKSRLQQKPPKYKNSLDAVMTTFKSEGTIAFFRGLGPCLLRTTPASAVTLGVYSNLIDFFGDKK